LVLVTHDPEVASRADRKIVLRDGLIVEDSLLYSSFLRLQQARPKRGREWLSAH
jgi:ABC-type lipoprotein export system ATPase subunit